MEDYQLKYLKDKLEPSKKSQLITIVLPQKFIPLSKLYLLKNCVVIDEQTLYDEVFQNKKDFDQKDLGYIQKIQNFKYIDHIVQNQSFSNVSNITAYFSDYQNSQINTEYLIKRFNSFGNKIFKETADSIQEIEKRFQQIALSQKQQSILRIFESRSKVEQKIQQLFQKFKEYPVLITYSVYGINNRLSDLQSHSINKKLMDLMGYESQELINQCMKKKSFPDYYNLQNKECTRTFLKFISSLKNMQKNKIQENINVQKDIRIISTITQKNGNKIDIWTHMYYEFIDDIHQLIICKFDNTLQEKTESQKLQEGLLKLM